MSQINPKKDVNLTIDGIPVTVPEGTRILEAARKVNVKIPTLCDYPNLCKRAICRLCVVEADGRGKLIAACANEVWEGVKIVTNNLRILSIRRTIVELILTNHPPECLNCEKNRKCELQTLTETYGIREIPFSRDAMDRRLPRTESKILARDMAKCVKCGRCVEVCQEIQSVRAINTSHRSIHYQINTPYRQSFSEGPCIFCCQCAVVCPVGAICEYDQSDEVHTVLSNRDLKVAIQILPALAASITSSLNLPHSGYEYPPGPVSIGKIITALKRIGFYKVYDAGIAANATVQEERRELAERIKKPGSPLITGCSPALNNFMEKFYPDLKKYLSPCKNPEQIFASMVEKETGSAKIKTVSIMPCIAKKQTENVDFNLGTQELIRLIFTAGIDFKDLEESEFDSFTDLLPKESVTPGTDDAVIRNVYEAYFGGDLPLPVYREAQDKPGIIETEIDIQGAKAKALIINGLANARPVLEEIRSGKCDAAFIEINCCSSGCAADADCAADAGCEADDGRHS